MDISVKIIEKELEFAKPDIDMIIKDDEPLFSFLISTLGDGIKPVLIDLQVRLIEECLKAISGHQTYIMQFIQIGENGMVFWPFISNIPHPGGILDPVNLMFCGVVDISKIEGVFTSAGLDWQNAPGTVMYALTQDANDAGRYEWKKMDLQLRPNGVVSMMRFEHHIRIYQEVGSCCIAAVHRDKAHTHKIGEDWTESRKYMEECLATLQGQNKVGAISSVDFHNAGTFHGYSNDGLGLCVEVHGMLP